MSNVQYSFKEVFLVAPTEISEFGGPIPPYSVPRAQDYTTQGFTWSEAKAICQNFGGDLASLARVRSAYTQTANWCPAGWTLDSQTVPYYLPNSTNNCGLTTPTEVTAATPAQNSSGTKMAFAICDAPKPSYPSVAVQPFNSTRYSVVPDTDLSYIMDGSGELFPLQFTTSQAYRAIDIAGFDKDLARKWLKTNYNTVDSNILTSQNYTDDPSVWTNLASINSQSCLLIKARDDEVSNKVIAIQTAFRDVSGYVIATVKSKAENAKIQAMLFEICSNTTPELSPACAKLATLDFDTFYTDPTHNNMYDLQQLNTELYSRREEICDILHNIRNIKSSLGCTYQPLIPECSQGCKIDNTVTPPIYDCSNTTIFDINAVGQLSYSLQQISPLFDVPAYNTLLQNVMESLSYVIETPSIANFANSDANLKLINTAVRDIQEMIQNDYAIDLAKNLAASATHSS